MDDKSLYKKGYDNGVKYGILLSTIVVTGIFIFTLLIMV